MWLNAFLPFQRQGGFVRAARRLPIRALGPNFGNMGSSPGHNASEESTALCRDRGSHPRGGGSFEAPVARMSHGYSHFSNQQTGNGAANGPSKDQVSTRD